MLHPLLLLLLISICLLLPRPLAASGLSTDGVEALVAGYAEPDEPGISVAISAGGQVIYEGWSGLADVERNVPIGPNTKFHIASISKQFTAFAILKLAEEGKLRLNQPVSEFFPHMEAGRGTLTIRHLLDHTGGLREVNTLVQLLGLSERAPVTAEQMLALILRQKGANFAAGSDEEYSNTGYQLLAHIVSAVSGQSFADYLQQHVLSPLGMGRTSVRTEPYALISDVAVSYDAAGAAFTHHPILAAGYGSTGMVSTPADLLRWGQWLNAADAKADPVVGAMGERSCLPDGRLVVAGNGQEFRLYRGARTWSHGGTAGGFKSFLLRFPEHDVVIAVMGNRSDFLKAAFAFDVADALLGGRLGPEPEVDSRPETTASLDSYVGDYRLFPGTVFSLRRAGQTLTFSGYGQEGAFPLPRLARGVFQLNPARDIRLVFRDFADGQATRMRWQVSEDGYLPAKRVRFVPIASAPPKLRRYTGTFYSDELQTGFEIFEKDSALWIASTLRGAAPLVRYQPNTFRPDGPVPFARLTFLEDGDGPLQTVLVAAPLAQGIVFQRQNTVPAQVQAGER